MSDVAIKAVDLAVELYMHKVQRCVDEQIKDVRSGRQAKVVSMYPPSVAEINSIIQALTAAEDRATERAASIAAEMATGTKGHTRAVATAIASAIVEQLSTRVALAT